VLSWSSLLQDVNPVHARQAVEAHFREKPDTYLNVGHVVRGAKRFSERDAERVFSSDRQMDESKWRSDPQPICRDHDLPITACDSCCDVLAEKSFWGVDERHNWAVKNIYRADSVGVV
jgi:hypothetical protein